MKYWALIILLPLFLCVSLASVNAAAQQQAKQRPAAPADATGTVSKINIAGTQRIDKQAILNEITTYPKGPYSQTWIEQDVRKLFAMGFFYNVEVLREGTGGNIQLTYRVTEKPSITEISFKGNSEIDNDELLAATGIKTFEILDMSRVNQAVEAIAKLYEDKGYFLARVHHQVQDITKDETVRLVFNVEENDKVKVKQINILGNYKLPDSELKAHMLTQEGGFFSFVSGSGAFKQDAFDRDLQLIKILYFNKGYVQVKVDRPEVYVTPDKKDIYISIRVEEGDQYRVGSVDFTGDLLFPKEELFKDIAIDDRDIFSWEVVQGDIAALSAKYGDLGYAFTNIIPRTPMDEKTKTVDLIFEIDKGNKVNFGEINVIGNDKTRDNVIRRELRIFEGELYNETRKRESMANIRRLGFFEDVNFRTSSPPDNPDVLNIDIAVKERSTGSIQVGAGYSSTTKLSLQGQVNQPNFLGKGQNISASLSWTEETHTYNLRFTEPYFLGTTWLVGVEGYRIKNTARPYIEDVSGAGLRIGHPLGDYLQGSLRYKYDVTELSEKVLSGVVVTDQDIHPLDTGSGSTSSLTGTIEYDTRNDRFSPSQGIYSSLSYEYAGLGGDLKYTKGLGTYRYFKNVFWDVVWRNNLSYGFVASLDDGDPPFNELFLLGGPYSLRGYRTARVGQRRHSSRLYQDAIDANLDPETARRAASVVFGGQQQLYLSTELEFPLIREAQIKGVVFYDIGQAEDSITPGGFHSNVGFGFRWFSPIGPLRFEWGFPIDRDPVLHPDAQVFEFSIGSPF